MKSSSIAALIFILGALPGVAQTVPPQAAGYRLVFSENFSKFDLSPDGFGKHTWYPGIYFHPKKPLPGAIAVKNSVLELQWDRYSGEDDTSIQGCSDDASHCNTYRYGYFEARMKWDVTSGAWPAFWLITKQGILGASHVGELDVFEGQGTDPARYWGTINEWNGPTQLLSTNSPYYNYFNLPTGNDFSQWHTYGLLWVPGRVSWYFDNKRVGSAYTPAIFDQQDFFMILGSQEGNHWQMGSLLGTTAQSINLDVAWVHVFQGGSQVNAMGTAAEHAPAPRPRQGFGPRLFRRGTRASAREATVTAWVE